MGALTAMFTGAIAVIAATAAMRRQVMRTTVRGHSMAPTYTDGERLLALRRRRYRRGDVIIFRVAPGAAGRGQAAGSPPYRIKRIVAVAGDPAPASMLARAGNEVPARHVAVAGDNVAHSQDSSHLGYICLDNIVGRPTGRCARAPAVRSPPS